MGRAAQEAVNWMASCAPAMTFPNRYSLLTTDY